MSCEFAAFLCEASCWQLRVQKRLIKHGDGHHLWESGRQQGERVAKEDNADHQTGGASDQSGSKRSRDGSQGKANLSRAVEATELSSCLKLMAKFSLTFNIRKGYIMC